LNLSVFDAVCICFLSAFVIQLVWWRLALPANEAFAIMVLYAGVTLVLMLFFHLSSIDPEMKRFTLLQYLHFAFFYSALLFSYLISYTAIKAIGPTFLVLLQLEKNKDAGLTRDDLRNLLKNELFLGDRLEELKVGGYVQISGTNNIRMTAKGVWYLRFFTFLRTWLRITYKGG
jgi:hypothetical protein